MRHPTDRPRCGWANGPWLEPYHDTEWGVPVHDDRTHFEFLVLEGAQAGLSWLTILKRREGYRKAFANFDVAKVARFTPAKIEKLLLDPGIIRNRAKVDRHRGQRQGLLARGRRVRLLRHLPVGLRGRPAQGQQVAAHRADPGPDPDLRSGQRRPAPAGFRFVGPTVCYSHLQAAGLVNDHLVSCFRYAELTRSGA